jgi:hypothetical protein
MLNAEASVYEKTPFHATRRERFVLQMRAVGSGNVRECTP